MLCVDMADYVHIIRAHEANTKEVKQMEQQLVDAVVAQLNCEDDELNHGKLYEIHTSQNSRAY